MKRYILLIAVFAVGAFGAGCTSQVFQAAKSRSSQDEILEQTEIHSSTDLTEPTVIEEVLETIPDCNSSDAEVSVECLVIKDSFEREQILQDNQGEIGFGWLEIIDDRGDRNGQRVDVAIYQESDMGPTPEAITDADPDLGRSIWYTGRGGRSVHSLYMISRPIDLSAFNSVMISFQYLAADLETWSWRGQSGNENVRLEVCHKSFADCGLGETLVDGKLNAADIDEEKLNSDAWQPYFTSLQGEGNGINGHNHSLGAWQDVFADIDLTALAHDCVSQFVFRIAVTIDEGFDSYQNDLPILSSDLRDGVAVDNVVAMASKVTVQDTCECELPNNDDETPVDDDQNPADDDNTPVDDDQNPADDDDTTSNDNQNPDDNNDDTATCDDPSGDSCNGSSL